MTTHFQPALDQGQAINEAVPYASHTTPSRCNKSSEPYLVSQNKIGLPYEAELIDDDQSRSLHDDIRFLLKYGLDFTFLRTVQACAINNGVDAHQELLARGTMYAETYFRLLALDLNLDFIPKIKPAQAVPLFEQRGVLAGLRYGSQMLLRQKDGTTRLVICPDAKQQLQLRTHLKHRPAVRDRLAITEKSTLKAALLELLKSPIEQHATNTMHRKMPSYSALKTTPRWSSMLFSLAFLGLLFFPWVNQYSLAVKGSIIASLLFFISLLPRLLAALDLTYHKYQIPASMPANQDNLPVYTVLIALYKEANVANDLFNALDQLDWPSAKLDIKLIVEADDIETRLALEKVTRHNSKFDVLVVPDGPLKTKPRALNYGLALARGAYVVVYDAEDRPDPSQLKAAFHRFQTTAEATACLQAPLVIDNAKRRWLPTMFEIEYAALFDGLLPALASWRAPILLGGTSNHFRVDVLRSVGAWDPYNVTEDADLGIRLKRFGYDIEMIDSPTYEEAPTDFGIWLKQRTRWFKGWMQTTNVHIRQPGKSLRQLGFTRFLSFHFHSSLLLFSALIHPFFLAFLVSQIVFGNFQADNPLVLILAGNLVFAYGVHALLSYRALAYRRKAWLTVYCVTLPAYWLLLSLAAWRALIQLFYAPHLWEKTPHGFVKRKAPPWSGTENQA